MSVRALISIGDCGLLTRRNAMRCCAIRLTRLEGWQPIYDTTPRFPLPDDCRP